MTGRVTALYRHPVKGFTPEPLARAALTAGLEFPCDRIYAVEDGPSGFDPAAPAYIRKQAFTVLAKIAEVAKARTAYDEATATLTARADGQPAFSGRLDEEAGRQAFAAWLAGLLGEAATGPLKVLPGPGGHRFMDHPQGHVSVINLASVRALGEKMGRALDPLRFRANILVEDWAPWAEMDWPGKTLRLGGAEATVFKPIVRCAAPDVDPATAIRDVEMVKGLFDHYGHTFCGVYLNVTQGGGVALGDAIEVLA
jgi:uncharacterized protein YcbX